MSTGAGPSIGGLLGGLTEHIAEIALGMAIGAAIAPLIEPFTVIERQALWSQFPELALDPADVADMVVQNIYADIGAGASEAAKSGLSADRFAKLVAVHGLPPGLDVMASALKRGLTDEATFRQAIAESHTKTKYEDLLVAMATQVLGFADGIELALKGAITTDQGIQIALANGYTSDQFAQMLAGTGNPISPTEATTLANRGQLTKAQFTEIVRLGRTRDDQVDYLWELRRHLPPLFEVRTLVAANAITDADATQIVIDQGYDATVAAGIIKAAHTAKVAKTHTLAQSTVESLYEGGYIDEGEAGSLIGALGYNARQVTFILETQDAVREHKALEAIVTRTHASYTHYLIELPAAQTELEGARIPNAAIKLLLTAWEHERAATVRRMTEAQVIAALKKGIFSAASAFDRLVAMGYPEQDANVLVWMATGKPVPGKATPPR